jgi:hypothetical protein
MDQDVGDQLTIELPGGGSLGLAGFGDPDGVPCLAFHGTCSSRLMSGWMFVPGLLTATGVRMIGVDRPGYGLGKVPIAPAVGEAQGEGGTRRDLRLELAEVSAAVELGRRAQPVAGEAPRSRAGHRRDDPGRIYPPDAVVVACPRCRDRGVRVSRPSPARRLRSFAARRCPRCS